MMQNTSILPVTEASSSGERVVVMASSNSPIPKLILPELNIDLLALIVEYLDEYADEDHILAFAKLFDEHYQPAFLPMLMKLQRRYETPQYARHEVIYPHAFYLWQYRTIDHHRKKDYWAYKDVSYLKGTIKQIITTQGLNTFTYITFLLTAQGEVVKIKYHGGYRSRGFTYEKIDTQNLGFHGTIQEIISFNIFTFLLTTLGEVAFHLNDDASKPVQFEWIATNALKGRVIQIVEAHFLLTNLGEVGVRKWNRIVKVEIQHLAFKGMIIEIKRSNGFDLILTDQGELAVNQHNKHPQPETTDISEAPPTHFERLEINHLNFRGRVIQIVLFIPYIYAYPDTIDTNFKMASTFLLTDQSELAVYQNKLTAADSEAESEDPLFQFKRMDIRYLAFQGTLTQIMPFTNRIFLLTTHGELAAYGTNRDGELGLDNTTRCDQFARVQTRHLNLKGIIKQIVFECRGTLLRTTRGEVAGCGSLLFQDSGRRWESSLFMRMDTDHPALVGAVQEILPKGTIMSLRTVTDQTFLTGRFEFGGTFYEDWAEIPPPPLQLTAARLEFDRVLQQTQAWQRSQGLRLLQECRESQTTVWPKKVLSLNAANWGSHFGELQSHFPVDAELEEFHLTDNDLYRCNLLALKEFLAVLPLGLKVLNLSGNKLERLGLELRKALIDCVLSRKHLKLVIAGEWGEALCDEIEDIRESQRCAGQLKLAIQAARQANDRKSKDSMWAEAAKCFHVWCGVNPDTYVQLEKWIELPLELQLWIRCNPPQEMKKEVSAGVDTTMGMVAPIATETATSQTAAGTSAGQPVLLISSPERFKSPSTVLACEKAHKTLQGNSVAQRPHKPFIFEIMECLKICFFQYSQSPTTHALNALGILRLLENAQYFRLTKEDIKQAGERFLHHTRSMLKLFSPALNIFNFEPKLQMRVMQMLLSPHSWSVRYDTTQQRTAWLQFIIGQLTETSKVNAPHTATWQRACVQALMPQTFLGAILTPLSPLKTSLSFWERLGLGEEAKPASNQLLVFALKASMHSKASIILSREQWNDEEYATLQQYGFVATSAAVSQVNKPSMLDEKLVASGAEHARAKTCGHN